YPGAHGFAIRQEAQGPADLGARPLGRRVEGVVSGAVTKGSAGGDMASKGADGVNDERIRRILEQAEAHGGLKQLNLPYTPLGHLGQGRRATRWEQLEFPWSPMSVK